MSEPLWDQPKFDYEPPEKPTEKSNSKSSKSTTKRFKQHNHFIDVVCRSLKPSQSLVCLILWRHAQPNGIVSVSHSQLAKTSGLSNRQIIRIVHQLQELKLVKLVTKGCNLTGKPSKYQLTFGE